MKNNSENYDNRDFVGSYLYLVKSFPTVTYLMPNFKRLENSWKIKTVKKNPRNFINLRQLNSKNVVHGKAKFKNKLVASGFLEENDSILCDSPTSSKESICLNLNAIASFCWPCQPINIKSAFYKITILRYTVKPV